MTSKTINLTDTELAVTYAIDNYPYVWLRNDSTAVVYASPKGNIAAGSDGVVSIPVGQSACVYCIGDVIYLLGTGSVMLVASNTPECPFKVSTSVGSSGGVDEVARNGLNVHVGNADIHVTAAQKSVWDGLSNPNLLINPDFAINQRGLSEYTTDGSVIYTVDRWRAQNYYKISVSDNGIRISPTQAVVTNNTALLQDIELPISVKGNAVTLSFNGSGTKAYLRLSALDLSGAAISSTEALAINGEDNFVSLDNIPLDAVKLRIGVNFSDGAGTEDYCELSWIKNEFGSIATPFCPPNPAAELLRCQRYFTIYKHQNATSNTDKCTIGVGYALTSSIVYAVLPIAAMRSGVAATVSYNGLSLISGADTVVDYTSVTALEQTDSTVQVAFTVSGQTPGSVYRLRLMNSNAYLAISKEL